MFRTTLLSSCAALILLGCDAVSPGNLDSRVTMPTQVTFEDKPMSLVLPAATNSPAQDTGYTDAGTTDALATDTNTTTDTGPASSYSVAIIMNPQSGVLNLSGGTVTYSPIQDFYGDDSYQVKYINTNTGRSTTYTVPVTVKPVNDAPTIHGQPTTNALAGVMYTFYPLINDIDTPKGELTITVAGLPAWADFNETTGAITGVVTAPEDEFVYGGLTVSVSDGEHLVSLPVWDITVEL